MKKQHVILLTVMFALMGTLFLAACQPATTGGASASSAASASAASSDAQASASEASASASAAEEAEASASSAEVASASASADEADEDGFKSIPATIPADHEGRTSDQCPTCHVEGGTAPAIPDDHFVDGELDPNRLQCFTCHLSEA